MSQQRGGSAVDPENLRLMYSTLFSRTQAVESYLWTIVSIALATEAGLWVGMLTRSEKDVFPTLLFGAAFAMVGLTSPLAIRFIELSRMLDRQLLDVYEGRLGLEPELALHHGRRLEERLKAVLPQLSLEAQASVRKRRVAKDPADARGWHVVDAILSKVGQPSLVWTAVISVSGVVGATTAVSLAVSNIRLSIVVGSALFLLQSVPWLLSAQTGPVARLRRFTSSRPQQRP